MIKPMLPADYSLRVQTCLTADDAQCSRKLRNSRVKGWAPFIPGFRAVKKLPRNGHIFRRESDGMIMSVY